MLNITMSKIRGVDSSEVGEEIKCGKVEILAEINSTAVIH